MADESQPILRAISWRDVFPFVNLFRAFRLAVHPSKMILALAALLFIYAGGRLLDAVWVPSYKPTADEAAMIVAPPPELRHGRLHAGAATTGDAAADALLALERDYEQRASERDAAKAERVGAFDAFFRAEVDHAQRALGSFCTLQLADGFDHVWKFVVVVPAWLWSGHWLYALIFFAWFLVIWSVFGGAISRIAAVHFARDEKISVRQALQFSTNKLLSFVFAPLIPIMITLAIGLILSATGFLLFHVPVAGPITAGLVWILALLGGLLMALVLLGLIGGFNLMYPTIAVEGSDSFDAISRSFSYVFARPWRMLWYTLVSLVYGGLCYLFVRLFIYLVLVLTWFFVGWWLTSKNTAPWYGVMFPKPTDFGQLVYRIDFANLAWSEKIAAGEIAFWNYLVISLLGAFAISFYFSASTIAYYLMRREVDATELEDVYVEEAEDDLADVGPLTGPAPLSPVGAVTEPAGPTIVTPETTGLPERPADAPAAPPPAGEGSPPPT